MNPVKPLFCVLFMISLLCACGGPSANKTEKPDDNAIDSTSVASAKQAYIFGLPLVLMELTRKNEITKTPENVITHHRTFPDHTFREVVRPNADTYYSSAILDLSKEPLVLQVPNTHGRYYLLPIMDAYTNVFTSPGTRTTGNDAKKFLITGPGWTGEVPEGMEQISSPTALAWMIGRTQVNSKADGEKVVYKIQNGYTLTPLSAWGSTYTPPANPSTSDYKLENPNVIVSKMPLEDYFNLLNLLMVNNPPSKADQPMMDQLAKIGVVPGDTFNINQFNAATLAAIQHEINSLLENATLSKKADADKNGWQYSIKDIGQYGTNYEKRAMVALAGLGANLPEDAIYPSTTVDAEGNPLDGKNNYVIHFTKDELPPVSAFWSLTVYDQDGFFTANPINRYAIGDRDKLKFNKDGSLDLYLQNTSPGKVNETNWLPIPNGSFNLLLRLYWPKEPVIKGMWAPPVVRKI